MNAASPYNDARTKSPREPDTYFCRYRERLGPGKYNYGYAVIRYEPGHGWFTGMKSVIVTHWAEINEPAR